MANTDNSCSHLEVKDEYSKSTNTLHDLLMLQKDIQEKVYGFDFKNMQENYTLAQYREFFDWNYHAISDELREMMDALGGVKHGIGNGVWKPWKKSYKDAQQMKFADMHPEDLLELKYELIDIQHFINNLFLAVGVTPQEFYNLYFSKNEENRNRQLRNY